MQALSDQSLVERSLKGDKAAFADLVSKYQRQIYSLTYNLTNNPEDAQDLAQEVFIKLYQVLDKYDMDKPFFSWMYKVSSNVCYTILSKKKKNNNDILSDDISEFVACTTESADNPEEYVETKEVQKFVQEAIAELPENYRVPLVLRYLEELSYKEIATILNLPITTIETRLYRGKNMLQKKLTAVLKGG